MIIQGIPTNQIIATAAPVNATYEIEFINTESSNSDVAYTLRLYLQTVDEGISIKLVLISNILAYPALTMSWEFNTNEYSLASKVYRQICDEVDQIKEKFDSSYTPLSMVAAQLREALKPISVKHIEKTNILSIDEAALLQGVSDWAKSIYANRYPNMSRQNKHKIELFKGNESEKPLKTREYSVRERY